MAHPELQKDDVTELGFIAGESLEEALQPRLEADWVHESHFGKPHFRKFRQ